MAWKTFFSIDEDFPKNQFTKDEILNLIDLMSRNEPTKKRLQSPNSAFIGKLVAANSEQLSETDLLWINNTLTSALKRDANMFCGLYSKIESKSLDMVKEHLCEKMETFLEEKGIKKANIADKKFQFSFSQNEINCQFSYPSTNSKQDKYKTHPERSSLEEIIENNLENLIINKGSYKENNKFSLSFTITSMNPVTPSTNPSTSGIEPLREIINVSEIEF